MILEILVLRVFREHFNQTLHSNHLIFHVCCVIHMFHTIVNDIGDSGAQSISRALQSNAFLTYPFAIPVRCFYSIFFHTQTGNTFDSVAHDFSRAIQRGKKTYTKR